MPVITMESSRLTREQKAQLIKEFTESAAKIMKMPPENVTVYLKENELENIGAGGKPLADIARKES